VQDEFINSGLSAGDADRQSAETISDPLSNDRRSNMIHSFQSCVWCELSDLQLRRGNAFAPDVRSHYAGKTGSCHWGDRRILDDPRVISWIRGNTICVYMQSIERVQTLARRHRSQEPAIW